MRSSQRRQPSGSWARARLQLKANWSPPFCSGCVNSAGSRAAPSRLNIAGQTDASSGSRRSPPSLSGSRSMSFLRRDLRCSQRNRRPRSSRSFSRRWRTLLHWPRRQPGAAGWQRHRPVGHVARTREQAPRTLARSRPRPPPIGDHGQCRLSAGHAGDGRSGDRGPPARHRDHRVENPAGGGYRTCLRGTQGSRGGPLCCCRVAHRCQSGSDQ